MTSLTPGQGLAFNEWEITAIAKTYGEGRTAPLAEVTTILASTWPQLTQAPVAEMLLQQIKRHAGSAEKPQFCFWARFNLAPGENAGDATALGKANAKEAWVDPIQNAMILRRLAGYLIAVSEDAREALEKFSPFAGDAKLVPTYSKFVQTYAALETTKEKEGGGPVIRTKNAVPGRRKSFRATTRMNTGNRQDYNWLRPAPDQHCRDCCKPSGLPLRGA